MERMKKRKLRRLPQNLLKVSKEEVYKCLIAKYNWTPDIIANMTFAQQLVALQACVDQVPKEITFSSMAEYQAWKQAQHG